MPVAFNKTEVVTVLPGEFEPRLHYYPQVLNAHIHPLVRFLMDLGNDRILSRYCHLHPEIRAETVRRLLLECPRYFRWGGADLFHVTTEEGRRQIVVIETNSSPSGQKSMPWLQESQDDAGYRRLLEQSFLPAVRKRKNRVNGDIAVLYDKNVMECSGYAATIANLIDEPVFLVPFFEDAPTALARCTETGILEVSVDGRWRPIRAAFRYVTQRPWNRIPPLTRTYIYNPVLVCLSGGRNKLVASKAYDVFNADVMEDGLHVNTPETIWDLSLNEVPMWIQRMGGTAVVKVPYSNAGQGVYTITNEAELDAFMKLEHRRIEALHRGSQELDHRRLLQPPYQCGSHRLHGPPLPESGDRRVRSQLRKAAYGMEETRSSRR